MTQPEDGILCWEDFVPGSVRTAGPMRVDRDEVLEFGRRFDPQPFHVDEAAARDSPFGGLIASGWHTCAMTMRMMCDAFLLQSSSVGSPGLEKIEWLLPVRPGDDLHLRHEVLESRPMASRPRLGLVLSRWEVFNQRDECVMRMVGWGMFRRRRPEDRSAAP